ncbi:histidine kinase [Hortaea werneckii]|nr:histidine kinase [Hortaea werneckii]KAI7018460.1 histidine kinase [Hortaea werneckii]KAI7671685.1 histidine kinase [Hortaea werneckii]
MAENGFLDLPAELRAVVTFFDDDTRPSVLVEFPDGPNDRVEKIYGNKAFQAISGKGGVEQLVRELGCEKWKDDTSHTGRAQGKEWRCKYVGKKHWALVCVGDAPVATEPQAQDEECHHGSQAATSDIPRKPESSEASPSSPKVGLMDWTRFDVPGLSPYLRFVKNLTGPPPLSDPWTPAPRLIIWGEGKTFIHNEACAPLFGSKHPGCLGKPVQEAFAEAWSGIDAIIESAYQGQTTSHAHLPLTLKRSEIEEETFWDFTLLPIVGTDGRVAGIIDELSESTSVVRAERRRHSLLHVSERLTSAGSLKELWVRLLNGLDFAVEDVPFAMVYSVVDDVPEAVSSNLNVYPYCPTDRKAVFEGGVGCSLDTDAVVQEISFAKNKDQNAISDACYRAWNSGEPAMLSVSDDTLPGNLKLQSPKRANGCQVRNVLVRPISIQTQSRREVVGILFLALDPRCPFDSEFQAWVQVLTDLIAKSATLITLPEEQKRAQKLADEINSALADQLRMSTLQVEASDAKFSRMAETSPIGMSLSAADGHPLYVNNAYLEMLGETREQFNSRASQSIIWHDIVHPDDLERFLEAWKQVVEQKTPITVEYRLKRPWISLDRISGHEISGEYWLLANAFPEISSEGKVVTVQGWLTDISHRKFTENLLSQRLEDALENKRQTENFIDMTSHEMRNPLSAILQSADSILSNLNSAGVPILTEQMTIRHDVAEEIIDAAQTIILCGQHQKRIVDDILTLSKLDASLLVISPDKVQPPKLVQKAFKMYESEISRAGITTRLCLEPSYQDLDVDWVILDSSRLLQVIINLLTNAVKFTQHSKTRNINVSLGASYQRPTGRHHRVEFIPPRHSRPQTPKSEWAEGEELFLQFAVQDSGRGLSDEEMKSLFQRFKQASPKTYKRYGGSGLGLFISRELCELQGGQIGVSSVHGKSTTFTFFVRAKRFITNVTDEDKAKRPVLHSFSSASASPVAYGRRGSVQLTSPSSAMDDELSSHQITSVNRATQSSKTRKPSKSGSTGLLHVLVVEDNLINQKVMSQQLRRAGCVVHLANHGEECLSFLQKTTFCESATRLDIVLLDLEMPTMDGLTCIRHIRQRQAEGSIQAHVPVIAVTANARSEQISVAIDAGMDSVVTKPFRIPELVPQMRNLIHEIEMQDFAQ